MLSRRKVKFVARNLFKQPLIGAIVLEELGVDLGGVVDDQRDRRGLR